MYKALVLLVLFFQMAIGQAPIHDLNKKLGKGINMGNMFEAPSETEWGNPFKDDYFKRISSLGFNHVRIPIRWDVPARCQQTEPYTINPTFLERIKTVVDLAKKENLLVIINMHHHEAIFANPDAQKAKFLSQWTQIATFFKDYDSNLLFEVMNEPNSNLTSDKWNTFFADALSVIRKTNKTRAILMGTSNWGGLGGVSSLKIPADDNLILTIHYYDPFNFTHQGADWVEGSAPWLGTKWENTNLERNEIIGQFKFLKDYSVQNNIPIHIGEFGAFSKADLESRILWTNFLARWFEQQGFSWAYWEFSAGFGIYNPAAGQFLQPLVEALTTKQMTDAKELKTAIIYESDFNSNTNKWDLYVQPTASASVISQENFANISVQKASTDGWHVQYVKNEIPLNRGKRYLVSFDSKANTDLAITNYIGQASGSYSAYSGYKSFTLTPKEAKFTYSFVMTSPDDPKARIVFDLGLKTGNVFLKNIKVEEVQETTSVLLSNSKENKVKVFPNPVSDELHITEIQDFHQLQIYDQLGRKILQKDLSNQKTIQVDTKSLPQGVYYLYLLGSKEPESYKLIKN
ncbi:cellulase family glycosylhydrolase [Lacihabitans soyangensis]|uniref:T9SS C-terminal target domain-containing protein n=1 Tax=Lacihabitans soyangensis TaxID=869394 RepID=A0AAE3H420_9BACT|nr:cellulase family glycosylhydrolase [Lacihabitans soyangensis]MCP9762540.1 T9SS C-terminal target domain-containing protein [Lacihabitans soyangensis]